MLLSPSVHIVSSAWRDTSDLNTNETKNEFSHQKVPDGRETKNIHFYSTLAFISDFRPFLFLTFRKLTDNITIEIIKNTKTFVSLLTTSLPVWIGCLRVRRESSDADKAESNKSGNAGERRIEMSQKIGNMSHCPGNETTLAVTVIINRWLYVEFMGLGAALKRDDVFHVPFISILVRSFIRSYAPSTLSLKWLWQAAKN